MSPLPITKIQLLEKVIEQIIVSYKDKKEHKLYMHEWIEQKVVNKTDPQKNKAFSLLNYEIFIYRKNEPVT